MVGSNSSDSDYMQPMEDETCTISQGRNETINHIASQVWNAYEDNKNIIELDRKTSESLFLIKIPTYDMMSGLKHQIPQIRYKRFCQQKWITYPIL